MNDYFKKFKKNYKLLLRYFNFFPLLSNSDVRDFIRSTCFYFRILQSFCRFRTINYFKELTITICYGTFIKSKLRMSFVIYSKMHNTDILIFIKNIRKFFNFPEYKFLDNDLFFIILDKIKYEHFFKS